MSFLEGELAVLNHHAKTGLPFRVGEICTVEESLYKSQNYDYLVRFEDGETSKVKESELSRLTDEQRELSTYIKVGYHVRYTPTEEVVLILKTDYIHGVAEVEFEDAGIQVVDMCTLKKLKKEIDGVGDYTLGLKKELHEEMLDVFFGHYKNLDDTYTLPKELIENMLKIIYSESE